MTTTPLLRSLLASVASLVLAHAASAQPLELDRLDSEQHDALHRWLSALTDPSLPCEQQPQAERPAFMRAHVAGVELHCQVNGRKGHRTRTRTAALHLTGVRWLTMPVPQLDTRFIGGIDDASDWATRTQYTLDAPFHQTVRQVTAWWEVQGRPAQQTAPMRWEASIEAGTERLWIQKGRATFTTSMSE